MMMVRSGWAALSAAATRGQVAGIESDHGGEAGCLPHRRGGCDALGDDDWARSRQSAKNRVHSLLSGAGHVELCAIGRNRLQAPNRPVDVLHGDDELTPLVGPKSVAGYALAL